MQIEGILALGLMALIFASVIGVRRAQGMSWAEVFDDRFWNCGGSSGLEWMGVSRTRNCNDHARAKDVEIAQLKERVATLERILTDPAERLKREIDRL